MWEKVQILRQKYLDLELQHVLDYEKFALISIVYHSTKIEGCSLSENDTRVLLENGITAKGKPLSDHLMVKDHYHAFSLIKREAKKGRLLSIDFIKEVAAMVMKNTGGVVSAISGSFDTSKGDLRLAQVYVDKKYFPDFNKIEPLLTQLVTETNGRIEHAEGDEILRLSADIHYNLVNIHPFGDGNGRTARLLMNYVQLFHSEPLIKVFTEDRVDYIDALNKAETKGDISIFRNFICSQQIKFYENEIEKFSKKGSGFTLMF